MNDGDPRLANLDAEQRASLAIVNRSHERDGERWQLSYTAHTATALRRRASAESNGRS